MLSELPGTPITAKFIHSSCSWKGLLMWLSGKESTCQCRTIPGLGRFHGEGNGNPFQYSCLENSMNRGAWQAMVCGEAESDTTEHTHTQAPGRGLS